MVADSQTSTIIIIINAVSLLSLLMQYQFKMFFTKVVSYLIFIKGTLGKKSERKEQERQLFKWQVVLLSEPIELEHSAPIFPPHKYEEKVSEKILQLGVFVDSGI